MSALHYGLTPKMKPVSPRRSAIVAVLDIGTSKIACLIARLKPQQPAGRAAAAQPRHRGARLRSHRVARGIKAGAVVDLGGGRGGGAARRRSAPSATPRCSSNRSCCRCRPAVPPANSIAVDVNIAGSSVTDGDIARVLAAGSHHSVRAGRAVLHSLPIGYALDGVRGHARAARHAGAASSASTCMWSPPT